MIKIYPYVTIGGLGTRLKQLSPTDKHLLYFKDKQIIEWILDTVPNCKIIGKIKTNNRKETLYQITESNNILIIDCDIIPLNLNIGNIDTQIDNVFVFTSNVLKYASILLDNNNQIISTSENKNISNIKSSGVYFIKNLKETLSKMTDNSILSGMIGAKVIYEDTFIRLGDIEDYTFAVKNIC